MGSAEYDALLRAAQTAGFEHGKSASSWVVGGNTSEETARRLLKGLDDGDPAVYDLLPCSPLSGEWAGAPTPATVFEDLGMTGEENHAGSVLDAYEAGFSEGVEDEVVRAATYLVADEAV